MVTTEERIYNLEQQVEKVAIAVTHLANCTAVFMDEVRQFKNGMLEFKDEMRMFKNEMLEFKDEMRMFKNEMLEFKDEMRMFKEDSLRERRRMNKAWGDLANKLGTIVEDIAAPNIRRLATEEFGFESVEDFQIRSLRTARRGPFLQREFDVICANCRRVLLGEMKSTPTAEIIALFAEKVRTFLDFFPEYEGREIIGIFASWSLSPDLVRCLSKAGLYGLAMGDETMDIVARPDFAA